MKDVQDLYTENYKTLQREITDNLNKNTLCPWINVHRLQGLNIAQTAKLPKLIFIFNAIPIKILQSFLKK